MYLINTPKWLSRLFRGVLFRGPGFDAQDHPLLYLTFDDGPVPGVTDKVLDVLAEYHAKGTFFCLGKQVEAHSELFNRIKAEGHTIGNHGYEHWDAYKSDKTSYLDNVKRGAELTSRTLFRPPYGRLTWSLYRELQKSWSIVLFSLMPGDFEADVSAEDVVSRVKKGLEPGSIVVLHDNEKAGEKLLDALPDILEWASKEGYICSALSG